MTNKELQEIKDRLAKAKKIWATTGPQPQAFVDADALIAEVERLRAIIAANPVMSKRGRPTFQRKGYDLAGPENHHSLRPGRTP